MGERTTSPCVGRARRTIIRGIVAGVVITAGVGIAASTAGAAEPALVVDPSVDLVDRQEVAVDATGFSPLTTFGAAQCDPNADPGAGIDGCDLSTSTVTTTDVNGAVHLTMQVRRIITVQGNEIDCALAPCTLGGATLDGLTPIEALAVPIAFDPAVPPVPALTLDLIVDAVSGATASASGTVTCNRDAEAFIDLFVVQEKGGPHHLARAFGSTFDPVACSTEPTEWTVHLDVFGRLTGGPASYDASAFAFDGFEDASVGASGEVQVTGGREAVVAGEQPGESVSVRILEAGDGPDGPQIEVEVTCTRAVPEGYVSVVVSQYAGLIEMFGFGQVDLGPCDGTRLVAIPVMEAYDLVGGPARVDAEVAVFDSTPGEEFFDFASATAMTRIQGGPKVQAPAIDPNPASRITILEVTRSEITGVVECEEPAEVDMIGFVQQDRGRVGAQADAFSHVACDGTTPFQIALEDPPPRGGPAVAIVYASAYRETEDEFQFLWEDYQAAAVSIKG